MKNTTPIKQIFAGMLEVCVFLFLFISLFLINSCASTVKYSSSAKSKLTGTVLLPPFKNATRNENASAALTDLMSTALAGTGLQVIEPRTSEVIRQNLVLNEPDQVDYLELARQKNTDYLMLGNVIEYRYKLDLDADPTVTFTLKIMKTQTGETIWHGTAHETGFGYTALAESARVAVERVIVNLPLVMNP